MEAIEDDPYISDVFEDTIAFAGGLASPARLLLPGTIPETIPETADGALFKAPNAEVGRGTGTRVRALESCESSAWTLSSSTEPPSPALAPFEHNRSPITGNGTMDVTV